MRTIIIAVFFLGILSHAAYDRWAWQLLDDARAASYPVEYVQPVQHCYLDALDIREDPDHGTVWSGVCDDGRRVEIAEHD